MAPRCAAAPSHIAELHGAIDEDKAAIECHPQIASGRAASSHTVLEDQSIAAASAIEIDMQRHGIDLHAVMTARPSNSPDPRQYDRIHCRGVVPSRQRSPLKLESDVVLPRAIAIETAADSCQRDGAPTSHSHTARGEIDTHLVAANPQRTRGHPNLVCGAAAKRPAIEVDAIVPVGEGARPRAAVDLLPKETRSANCACDLNAVVGLRCAAPPASDPHKLQRSSNKSQAAVQIGAYVGIAPRSPRTIREG